MKDFRGIERGQCKLCGHCSEYLPPQPGSDGKHKCATCSCPPGRHASTTSPTRQPVSTPKDGAATSTDFIPSAVTRLDGLTTTVIGSCVVPGCGNNVDFNPNTGEEYLHCQDHSGVDLTVLAQLSHQLLAQGGDTGNIGGIMPTLTVAQHDPSMIPAAPTVVPPGMKCAIAKCQKLRHMDENGTLHECCSKFHSIEHRKRSAVAPPSVPTPLAAPQSSTPSSVTKCAIFECPNARYRDPSGTLHECCGITHAMEHQRRQALMKQTNNQVIKGVTHCYLPECNKPTWPFMNYCGKTHAQLGQQRPGLPPPPPLTSGPAAGTGAVCVIPGCMQPKYIDPVSGVTHDYCSKSHAEEGKQKGIRAQADKPEEECELPGCTNRKRTEAGRVHNYCCQNHAAQDVQNRAARALTTHAEVLKFLSQFSNLQVVSLDENVHAKPGGQLFNHFKNAFDSLPRHQQKTILAFHGTAESNIQSICSKGYDPSLRRGQAHGAGEYFATKPNTPMGYCQGGKKMLLNELLLGQAGTHHTQHGDIVVMKNPDHDLPRYVITFK